MVLLKPPTESNKIYRRLIQMLEIRFEIGE